MSKSQVSILAIGNELTSGKIYDTNSTFLCRELTSLGFEVRGIELVRDQVEEILHALRWASSSSNLVFTTGGLGPTSDDLTRDALALFVGAPLEESAVARTKLEALFAARKRPLHENNLRQVQFPQGAEVITNRNGTADAFVTHVENSSHQAIPVVSLPGVPAELELIFAEQLRTWLSARFSSTLEPPIEKHFRCFGCSESYLGRQIEDCRLPSHLEVAYRPMFPEVLISILHKGTASPEAKAQELLDIEQKVADAIGAPFLIGRKATDTLPSVLGQLLIEKNLTLAAAESCSGGLLAHALVSIPGSSKFFLSSVVAYSNDTKATFLGVRPALLTRWGAVSREIAVEMAHGAKYRAGADFGVSITGVAGPDGGSEEKPVGTFFIGLSSAKQEEAWEFFYPHERNMLRQFSAYLGLDLVRRTILGFPTTWDRK